MIWYYHLDPALVSIDKLNTLVNQLANVQNQFQANYADVTSLQQGSNSAPYLTRMVLSSSLFGSDETTSTLEAFQSRISVAQIPIAVLGIMIMVLILFFVSLMTGLLVERQNDAIALLRSRGASSGQIFWALMTQSISLGLFALLLGIPLSLFAVYTLSKKILPAGAQDALNVLTTNAGPLIVTGIVYALSIVLIVLLTMGISLFVAARADVLTLRRQSSSRSQRRPLWQRLNLDILAGIIALGGYAISFYLTSLGNVLGSDAQTLIATPLTIVAPFFLIIGCMFLFLRIFPIILGLIASLVVRGRGAVSMLALAQIGRSPRQAIRMALLLALAVAFALFTLVYTASQSQHIQDISIYQVGADFSGRYTQSNSFDVTKVNAHYKPIVGVLSASSGYVGQASGGKGGITMEVRAVDAATFASAVIWPSAQETEAGTTLLAQEVHQRAKSIKNGVVPAIIDTHTANQLFLHVGSFLTVRTTGLDIPNMETVVIGIVPHVPTVNDRIGVGGKKNVIPGGILIDYPTYETIYSNELQKMKVTQLYADTPAINSVWLHSRSDADSLANVRLALKQPTRTLQGLNDRWAILASLQNDPLYLILSGLLIVGTVTALLLALVGDLLASWLSASVRLTNFAVLRAIGTTPREVASMLTYEQSLVYITGLLLGIGFGTLLSFSVIPALSLTDINSTLPTGDQFYALQTAFPTRIIIPPTLLWGLLVVVVLYGVALTMMVRIVSKPTMSQTLRLNED
jgi:ABC-type lipoprotein release transport system permease subunit